MGICKGPIVSAILSPLYISLIGLTNTLQIFNYKYVFLITKILIIIIGLLENNYYYFYYIYKIPFIASWKFKVESWIEG